MGSRGKNKTALDKPWFDKDCKQAKNKLKLLGTDITQNPQNDDLRKKLCYDKNIYKKLIKQKNSEYTKNIVQNMKKKTNPMQNYIDHC